MATRRGPSKKRPHLAPARPRPSRRSASWRTRVGWPLAIAGLLMFLLGNIGARTGIVFLSFDRHHVFEQIGGALLGILGLVWATR
jgi:hypothetical protein